MLILQAAREVVESDGFDDRLNNVRDRIDEIESLHRTRELTVRARVLYRFSSACHSCTLPRTFFSAVQGLGQRGSHPPDGRQGWCSLDRGLDITYHRNLLY